MVTMMNSNRDRDSDASGMHSYLMYHIDKACHT